MAKKKHLPKVQPDVLPVEDVLTIFADAIEDAGFEPEVTPAMLEAWQQWRETEEEIDRLWRKTWPTYQKIFALEESSPVVSERKGKTQAKIDALLAKVESDERKMDSLRATAFRLYDKAKPLARGHDPSQHDWRFRIPLASPGLREGAEAWGRAAATEVLDLFEVTEEEIEDRYCEEHG